MWCLNFSRLVPLGGATSLVTTNLPDSKASLNGVGISLFPLYDLMLFPKAQND
jgi:hypothetical protein